MPRRDYDGDDDGWTWVVLIVACLAIVAAGGILGVLVWQDFTSD